MIEGVIFDVDGTLIDSNDAHARSWEKACAGYGFSTTLEQIRRLIGKGGDKVLPELTGVEHDSPMGKAISEKRKNIFQNDFLPNLKAFPQVSTLLEALLKLHKKLFIATSASDEDLSKLLAVTDLDGYFPVRASSKDVEHSKPDPDIILAAIQKSKLNPARLVMVGDTPYDIEAASRAGIKSIGLLSGGWDAEALKGATETYGDAADLFHQLAKSVICTAK